VESLQSIVDRRASALYRMLGFSPESPPSLFRFAQGHLGLTALRFVGAEGVRGASLARVSKDRCEICLQRGLPDEENGVAIARGLAAWDIARGGCPIEPIHAERLALSIALPLEVMEYFQSEGTETVGIARAMFLPVAFVSARERAFVKLRSVRRLAVAPALTTLTNVAG
jgi:hypothetical protein